MAEMHDQKMVAYSPVPVQMGQQPQTVVVVPAPQQNNVEGYPCKAAIILGACQIILGILFLVAGIMDAYFGVKVGFSVITGILFILAGAFEVTSGKSNTRCWLITTMVFGILAALFAFGAMTAGGLALSTAYRAKNIYEVYLNRESNQRMTALCIGSGFYTFFAFVEFIIAIVAASLTCKPVCCAQRPLQQGVQIVSPQQGQQAAPGAPPVYAYQSAGGPPATYPSSTTANYPPLPPGETRKVPFA